MSILPFSLVVCQQFLGRIVATKLVSVLIMYRVEFNKRLNYSIIHTIFGHFQSNAHYFPIKPRLIEQRIESGLSGSHLFLLAVLASYQGVAYPWACTAGITGVFQSEANEATKKVRVHAFVELAPRRLLWVGPFIRLDDVCRGSSGD